MKYELFTKLYREAKQYEDVDMYIAERGWQEWMNRYTAEDNDSSAVAKILTYIFEIAHTELVELKKERNMSRVEFIKIYGVPNRTAQDWDYGKNEIKTYFEMLFKYTFFMDYMEEIY